MSARRIANLVAAVVLAASGTYLFVYLYRWEWNRAIISACFFLAAEIAIASSAILQRLQRLDAKLDDAAHRQGVARRHLNETAPEPRDHFAWLSPHSTEMNVFVPVLIGAGFVLSGLAWVVERLSRATAGVAMEDALARRLGPLVLPRTSLVPTAGATALLDGPSLRERR